MQINKEILLNRIGELEEELVNALNRVQFVQGALSECRAIERFLEAVEPINVVNKEVPVEAKENIVPVEVLQPPVEARSV